MHVSCCRQQEPAPARVEPGSLQIDPKVSNDGHRMIVDKVLPVLFQVMQEEAFSGQTPLLQAREALKRLDRMGQRFWGSWCTYSRKRTVEDILVSRYYEELRLAL